MGASRSDAASVGKLRAFGGDVAALVILYQAWEQAEEAGVDVRRYAVPLGRMDAAGIPHDGLIRLLRAGLIRHAGRGTPRRSDPELAPESRFVLTSAGARLFEGADSAGPPDWIDPTLTPVWHPRGRELSAGGWPVKRFRTLVGPQKTVLDAFQEENWPRHIDDPLPPSTGRDHSQRLRDTVRFLNDHQIVPLIRFASDGRGTGFYWRWVLPRRRP